MRISNRNTFAVLGLAIVAVIIICLKLSFSRSDSLWGSGPKKSSLGQSESPDDNPDGKLDKKRPRERSANSLILERLRKAGGSGDARELISLVPLLHEKELLLDKEVAQIYAYRIASFTDGELADLANAWPDKKNTQYSDELMAIARLISQRNDPNQFIEFMNKLSPDKESRPDIIMKMGQKMSMFSVQEIGNYVTMFNPGDGKSIGNALTYRIENSAESKSKKIEIIGQYLGVLTDDDIIKSLVKQHLTLSASDDPLATLKWVYEQDPNIASACDKPVIDALIKDHPQEVAEYVNSILLGDDKKRADKALEYMVDSYSKRDPEAALSWVINLPKEVGVFDQLIVTPFLIIKSKDSRRAQEILDSTKDLRIKQLLQRVSR